MQTEGRLLADKLYYLNKMMNGVDLYHQIELPAVWGCEHPMGSIMGRATFGEAQKVYDKAAAKAKAQVAKAEKAIK